MHIHTWHTVAVTVTVSGHEDFWICTAVLMSCHCQCASKLPLIDQHSANTDSHPKYKSDTCIHTHRVRRDVIPAKTAVLSTMLLFPRFLWSRHGVNLRGIQIFMCTCVDRYMSLQYSMFRAIKLAWAAQARHTYTCMHTYIHMDTQQGGAIKMLSANNHESLLSKQSRESLEQTITRVSSFL